MQLTVILPGISEVLSAQSGDPGKRLSRMTARSLQRVSPHRCYEQAMLDALGLAVPDFAGLPAAQCCYLTDFNETAPARCARADPVHLQADKDHARLVPAECLQLEADESAALVESLNAHFAADKLRFSIGKKGRWYIAGVPEPAIATLPTSQVAGRNVTAFLPGSADTAHWRSLATEVQMLLHAHDVNARREARGLLPINALWFWGGGKLPGGVPGLPARLYSDAAIALGVGRLNAATVMPLDEILAGLPAPLLKLKADACVVVLDTRLLEAILLADTEKQHRILQQLDEGLLRDAQSMLLRGQLSSVRLDCCDGQQFDLTRNRWLQFWKKARPMGAPD